MIVYENNQVIIKDVSKFRLCKNYKAMLKDDMGFVTGHTVTGGTPQAAYDNLRAAYAGFKSISNIRVN